MNPLEQYYRNNYRGQLKLMTRILRGDVATAEDVVQEAYCRALKFWPAYDSSIGGIQPWFNRILFNSLRDVQHEFNRAVTNIVSGIDPQDVMEDIEDPSVVPDYVEAVENEYHRRILTLFFIYGYNSREISQMMEKTPQSTVTTIVSRFKESLV